MSPNTKMRLNGLLVCAVAVAGTAYDWYYWYSVLAQGVYYSKTSFLFPFLACVGLSVLLYPMSTAESLSKYGTEQMPRKPTPFGQKALILLGIVLGGLQSALFSGHISL